MVKTEHRARNNPNGVALCQPEAQYASSPDPSPNGVDQTGGKMQKQTPKHEDEPRILRITQITAKPQMDDRKKR
jgi:hypothetical protein